MRAELIERSRQLLAQAGFFVSRRSRLRPVSFDLVARRDNRLLIVKVLTNVDSLSGDVAEEMRLLSNFLDATPVLLGERSSSRELEPGVIYLRHGIPIVTLDTLHEHLLEGLPPMVYAAPGGFYVNIDGGALRAHREERGLSLGDLAQAAGVSRRAISMYEEGMGAMVEVAAALEDYLDAPIVRPLDPWSFGEENRDAVVDLDRLADALELEIYRLMERTGFRVVPVGRSPFNAISSEDAGNLVLTGVSERDASLARRARAMANLCEVTEKFGAVFLERRDTTRLSVEGTPLIGKEELAALDAPDALLDLIAERRQRKRE